MEVRIERDAHSCVDASTFEDFDIGGRTQADIAGMENIPTLRVKYRRC